MRNRVIKTETASLWLDQYGIIHVNILPGAEVNIQHTRDYVTVAKRFGNTKRLILVDISKIKSASREARDFFKQETGSEIIKSVALIIGSPVSKVIGNFLIGLNKPSYPIKLFTSEKEAEGWLRQFQDKGEG